MTYEVQMNYASRGGDESFSAASIAEVNAVLAEAGATGTFRGAMGDEFDIAEGGFARVVGDGLEAWA